jgi:phospholipid transport system transporter-binding protein
VSRATLTSLGNGRYTVTGDLDFTGVGPLVADGERLFPGPKALRIDLSGVGQANSAGLALLLEWLDQARRRGQTLRFFNLPEPLARIAAITNLTGLLPCEDETHPERMT